ncbi:radical SAM family heme chaperone HemW [Chachezhania sediminis]|uniref:radical SAM family heme chaperone HemW n=1 Tax=Chachezhania sediminis TaxID=2599291 RepID=UPI00131D01A8|nr:radical SAM family heme chaperone HemW [Chachezhania sediminis]
MDVESVEGGFGLYVHWPFCAAKCPYCDFNSHVAKVVDHRAWVESYLSEIKRISSETGPRVLNTIFFGGGTPSLMEPETVAAVIDAARAAWLPANDMEITLEANPGSVEAGRFAAFRQAGVNRVSLGVQALHDPDLRRLGRIHSVAEARTAFDIARNTFDRVSFDLIYARQDQSREDWRRELTEALSMTADHLSLYQLTVEDGTVFGARAAAGHLRGLPDEDLGADLYQITQDLCEARGLPAYEVSNHAVPGSESRHNLIYWHAGDWAGIGPGAHGRLTINGQRFATETAKAPAKWLKDVHTGSGYSDQTTISGNDQADEYLIMGLRLTEGIEPARYARLSGQHLSAQTIAHLSDLGLIAETSTPAGLRLAATRSGRAVLNAVIAELAATAG